MKGKLFFKNNEIRKDYRLYFFVLSFFGPTLNQRRGIQKQNTTIQTISKITIRQKSCS